MNWSCYLHENNYCVVVVKLNGKGLSLHMHFSCRYVLSSVCVDEMDADWLLYNNVVSPVVFISFAATLLCNFICGPILMKLVAPKRAFGKKEAYMHSLLASTIHAIIACTNATIILIQGDLSKSRTFAINTASVTSLHVTMGYVLADCLACLIDPYLRSTYSNLIHHFAMISGILLCLYYELFVSFVIYRLLSEFSTPFVNWRALLHELGDKRSRWYTTAALGMSISFFLCRVLVIPWHEFSLFTALLSNETSTVPLILKAIMVLNSVPFDILNGFWFYKILKGAKKYLYHKKVSIK